MNENSKQSGRLLITIITLLIMSCFLNNQPILIWIIVDRSNRSYANYTKPTTAWSMCGHVSLWTHIGGKTLHNCSFNDQVNEE
jgi:hypothetical protein